MKMSALTVQTQNRKLGYVSQRAKRELLKDLLAHNLISNLQQNTVYVWCFDVVEDVRIISEVENKLRAGHVAFRKER